MNNCVFIGRVSSTPMISAKEGATKVARYRLGVDSNYTDKDGNRRTAFINCVAFGKNADFVEQHLQQGDKISIIASVLTGEFTDKDGAKHYTTEFVVSNHEFAETKAEKERRRAEKAAQAGQPGTVPAQAPVAQQPQPMQQPMAQPVAPVQTPQPVYQQPYQQPVAQPQPMAPVIPVAPVAPVAPAPQPVPAPAAPVAPVAPIAPAADFSGFNAFAEFPFN